MIPQNDVPTYREERLPEKRPALQKTACPRVLNMFSAVQCLADFTRNMVVERDKAIVHRCLNEIRKESHLIDRYRQFG